MAKYTPEERQSTSSAICSDAGGSKVKAQLPWAVPVWEGMRAGFIDLNGGSLRVAGGGIFKF